jgi:hypothetical protein
MRRTFILKWLIRLLAALLLGAGGISAARFRAADPQPPAVPAELVTRSGRLVVIRAEAAARVVWHACPTAGPLDRLALDQGRTLVAVAPKPGRYELIAWTAHGGEPTDPARCVLRVEGEPAPPAPDAFAAAVQTAWRGETDPDRDRDRRQLAAVYRVAARETVRLPHLRTHGELWATLRQAAAALLPDSALPAVRGVIAAELRQTLPTDAAAPLDDAARGRCAAAFDRVAAALERLDSPTP